MNSYSSRVIKGLMHKPTQPVSGNNVSVSTASVRGRLIWRFFFASSAILFCLVETIGGEPFSPDDQAVLIHTHGWDGASLPFEFREDRLTLWHCRATCGAVRRARLKAIAFVKGEQRQLADVSGPMVAGSTGTLYVVRSEPAQREARKDEKLVAIGFSFDGVSRDAAVPANDAAKNRQMVRFIAPREDFCCGVGEEEMLSVFLFGSAIDGADEQERVSDAAAHGDLNELFDAAKACERTTVVIIVIAAE